HPHTAYFCRFMARRAKNGGKSFRLWTDDGVDEKVLKTWRFICYVFVEQWSALKKYANENGVSIIGDIPIYVSGESSDIMELPGQFMLDERYMPTKVAGVPPDYFSEDGQLWGNPLYDWKAMKADGFRWWRDRIGFMCELFDCVRIDHFRGIESFYTCDPDAENAKNGKWKKGPGMELINAIKEAAGDRMLIAEDLGIITPEVEKLVRTSGFPGMKVLEFGFADGGDNPHLPHNYEKSTVAYTGTHDNNTLLGFIWELDGDTRSRVLEYCGYKGGDWNSREAYKSVWRTMLESHADTVIFPLQDILLYGADTRMNTPGVKAGNWSWRVTRDALETVDRGELRRMNELYNRYGSADA
ncbi:MAG: 4-alpha-glucanotransferase, partial [Clostridia bacterium]|nr:4-alpha-glucanotransferase [Clostridia bacterium]